jgi:hypothetical protein
MRRSFSRVWESVAVCVFLFTPIVFSQDLLTSQKDAVLLESILNPDGSLQTGSDFQGSLDPAGWRMTLDAQGNPRFVREESLDTYPAVPSDGDANWDDQFVMAGANGDVNAIGVDGINLYIAGNFTMVGNVEANKIAQWNGSAWSALGDGLGAEVNALAMNGSNVIAGGFFTKAGSVPANRIAQWNGSSWSAMGSGVGLLGWAGENPLLNITVRSI